MLPFWAFEQIKLDIDQQKANVKLVGYADYPNLGPTHKGIDAKKLMKLLKILKVTQDLQKRYKIYK